MQRYLCKSRSKEADAPGSDLLVAIEAKSDHFGFYQKCLQRLSVLFDLHFSVELLSRLYGIVLTPTKGGKNTEYTLQDGDVHPQAHCSAVSDVKLRLDQLQAELLCAVCIPGVLSINVVSEALYVDVPALLGTFPHLTYMAIYGISYIPYCSYNRSDRDISTSLTSVLLHITGSYTSLPMSHVSCLLQQPNLLHLDLNNIDILTVLDKTSVCQPMWSHLQRLSFSQFFQHSTRSVPCFCDMLQSHCKRLHTCILRLLYIDLERITLTEQALKTLDTLQNLELLVTLPVNSDGTIQVLRNVLPHLPSLQSVAVWYPYVKEVLSEMVDILCELNHGVKCLRIYCGSDELSWGPRWQSGNTRLPPLRPGFDPRDGLKWESW